MKSLGATIVGVGATPYYFRGDSAPRTLYELIGTAALAAAADAGLPIAAVDGFAFYASGFEPGMLTEMLGIPRIGFAATVASGGGGAAGVLDLAAMAIETGRATTVLCVGACLQGQRRFGRTFSNHPVAPDAAWSFAAGLTGGPGQTFALAARRHMHLYGTRREAFAEVVMASRDYAASRPQALRRKPLTLDDYMAAPMLADPMCRYDFCVESDGAVAVIVTSAERARDRPQPPVHVLAAVHGGDGDWGRSHMWLNMPDESFASAGGRSTARRLYEQAGVTPADIDVALLYDHFSPLVVMQLEDYGFCPRGEGGAFVEGGALRLGGAIPVNPHGGHLSEAYIIGMTHLREAVEQMRGVAGNQVPGARLALVTGGPAPIPLSAAILAREPA